MHQYRSLPAAAGDVLRGDPLRAPVAAHRGGSHLGYLDHDVVDGGKARIIANALATPADVTENRPMPDLVWRACFRFRLHPRQVTGDATYGTIARIHGWPGELARDQDILDFRVNNIAAR